MTMKMYDLAGKQDARRFSPYCWRIRMALAHKGLPCELIPWRFTEVDAIACSGQDKVPVLVDGDRVVHDSWQIANYLEDTYPGRPALFGSPAARGASLFIKHWMEQVLHPVLGHIILLDVVRHLHEKDQAYFRESREQRLGMSLEAYCADRETMLPRLREVLSPLRSTLQTQPYLGGDGPAFGDYIVFGAFQWARCTCEMPLLEEHDPLYAWRARLLGLFDGLAGKAMGYAP